jgi:hypothetical protein
MMHIEHELGASLLSVYIVIDNENESDIYQLLNLVDSCCVNLKLWWQNLLSRILNFIQARRATPNYFGVKSWYSTVNTLSISIRCVIFWAQCNLDAASFLLIKRPLVYVLGCYNIMGASASLQLARNFIARAHASTLLICNRLFFP